jgi:hypothetical protein
VSSRLLSVLQADFLELRRLLGASQQETLKPQITNLRNFCWSYNTFGTIWTLPPFLEVSGSLLSTEEKRAHVYRISVRFRALFCLKVFCIELELQHPSLFSLQISTIGSSMKLKNLVPETAEIILACSQGDTSRVWHLLQSKNASVNDITINNYSPLAVRNE